MAGGRLLGPTCQDTCPVQVKDGTTCCAPTGSPRPVGTKLHKTAQEELRRRLAKLIQLRAETVSLYDKLTDQLNGDFDHYSLQSMFVDAGPDIAEAFAGIVSKGLKILKIPLRYVDTRAGGFVPKSTWARSVAQGGSRYQSTITLAKKNLAKQSAKKALEIAGNAVSDRIKEDAAKKTTKAGEELLLRDRARQFDEYLGLTESCAGILVTSFLNIGSISFWAAVAVNRRDGKSWSESVTEDADDLKERSIGYIEQQKDSSLRLLDRKIDELKREIYR